MKTIPRIVAGITATVALHAQSSFTYEGGTISDYLHPTNGWILSLSPTAGVAGSAALVPGDVSYSINFLRLSPRDFSIPNSIIGVSTYFKIKRPTNIDLGVRAIELGFSQNLTASSFISPGRTSTIYWSLTPNSTSLFTNGFRFTQSIGSSVFNGTTSAGRSWTNPNALIYLKENVWYKAEFVAERISDSIIKMSAYIDDYGSDGQAFIQRVTSTGSGESIGSETYPYSILASDSTLYPAIHGRNAGGLSAIDNTDTQGPASPNLTAAIEAYSALEVVWNTIVGKDYYVQRSINLVDWEYIEGPLAGNGSSMSRIYSLRHQPKQFYRITTEGP